MKLMKNISILAVIGTLSACVGGTDDGGAAGTVMPVTHTDANTLETNLGIQDGVELAAEGATTVDGTTTGGITITYGSNVGGGSPATLTARLATATGDLTTPVISNNTTDTLVMNGKMVKAVSGAADVVYLPSTGSDMHVGMFRRQTNDNAGVGIFGQKTTAAAATAKINNGGTATYSGVTEVSIEDAALLTTHNYAGDITATADFGTQNIDYTTGTLNSTYNNGGPASVTMVGTGTVANDGSISGNMTVTPAGQADINTNISGALYGPTGQNMGIIIQGPGVAGGAVLNQN